MKFCHRLSDTIVTSLHFALYFFIYPPSKQALGAMQLMMINDEDNLKENSGLPGMIEEKR